MTSSRTTTSIYIAARFRVKPYIRKLPEYAQNLPKAVMEILVNKYEDLLPEEIIKLAKFDMLQILPGLPLIDKEELTKVLPLLLLQGEGPHPGRMMKISFIPLKIFIPIIMMIILIMTTILLSLKIIRTT
jgi:hypothetical protein